MTAKDVMNLSLSDMESSALISDEELGISPNKITPASKRKRDVILATEGEERNEMLGLSNSGMDSSEFLDMERLSPEPRRKNPSESSPEKTVKNAPGSTEKQTAVPDVVGDIDFDKNLPETVTLLRAPDGSKVYLVGTAHFSHESQDDVSKVIRAVQPHCVMVELCFARTDILRNDEEAVLAAANQINTKTILALLKKDGIVRGCLYLTILTMSAHVTRELGMAPGGEFRRAYQEAAGVKNCLLMLGDRDIAITVTRALAALSWWQCIKLFCNMVINKDPIKKEDVEKCKRRDLLEAMLAELAGEFPGLTEVLVNERDKYLTYSLQNAIGSGDHPRRVVGVVGIGHVPGIQKYWGTITEEEVAVLMSTPPTSKTSKVLRFTIRCCLFGGAVYVLYKLGPPIVQKTSTIFNKWYEIVYHERIAKLLGRRSRHQIQCVQIGK